MALSPYLDDDSLKDLDEELNQNSTLMHDLNSKYKKEIDDVEKMSNDYISNIKNCSGEKMKKTMASIESKIDTGKKLWDDKVQISKKNCALLEKRIANLDNAILNLVKQTQLNADIRETALKAKQSLDPKKARAVTNKPNKTKSVDNVSAGTSCSSGADMPIDPNEPTFCLCKQVSFGEIIACYNPDCAIEWFHFECVSLITAPKGKWFCANCIKNKKKK